MARKCVDCGKPVAQGMALWIRCFDCALEYCRKLMSGEKS